MASFGKKHTSSSTWDVKVTKEEKSVQMKICMAVHEVAHI